MCNRGVENPGHYRAVQALSQQGSGAAEVPNYPLLFLLAHL